MDEMWDRSITLMHQIENGRDPDGFTAVEHICVGHVPAMFQDLTRNDQILANQRGYEADQNIEIMACNYHDETLLTDEETGKVYEIMRTFRPAGSRRIILTCRSREKGVTKKENGNF